MGWWWWSALWHFGVDTELAYKLELFLLFEKAALVFALAHGQQLRKWSFQ